MCWQAVRTGGRGMRYCDLCQYEVRSISCLFAPANRLLLPSPNHIVAIVSKVNSVSLEDLRSTSRKRQFVESRAIAASLIKNYFPKMTLVAIAQLFNKDHSTIIYNLSIASDLCLTDRKFRSNYMEIKKQIDKIMRRETE